MQIGDIIFVKGEEYPGTVVKIYQIESGETWISIKVGTKTLYYSKEAIELLNKADNKK